MPQLGRLDSLNLVSPLNPIACCQRAFFEAHAGSNGVRVLSTPSHSMTSFRRHAPMACILGLPTRTRRSAVRRRRAVAIGRCGGSRPRGILIGVSVRPSRGSVMRSQFTLEFWRAESVGDTVVTRT